MTCRSLRHGYAPSFPHFFTSYLHWPSCQVDALLLRYIGEQCLPLRVSEMLLIGWPCHRVTG